jgi:hypothetical protein
VQVLLFYFILFFIGCFNNSHIRTQRTLKDGEEVFSLSASENLFGELSNIKLVTNNQREEHYSQSANYNANYAPIAAVRGELSILKGYKGGEIGYYVGGGGNINVNSFIGLVGGEYNKYLYTRKKTPYKAGVLLELNRTNNGLLTLHSMQSIKTTTTKKSPFFAGLHTLFSRSNIVENSAFNSSFKSGPLLEYKQITTGLGFTSGIERFFDKNSFIFQIDISFIKNKVNNLSSSFITINSSDSSWKPIVCAGFALNFEPSSFSFGKGFSTFKTPVIKNKISKKKTLLKKINPEPKQITRHDSSSVLFDPKTGKRIKIKTTILRFDPETGNVIQEKDKR